MGVGAGSNRLAARSDEVTHPATKDVDGADEEAARTGNVGVDEVDQVGDDIGVAGVDRVVAVGVAASRVVTRVGCQFYIVGDIGVVGLADGSVLGVFYLGIVVRFGAVSSVGDGDFARLVHAPTRTLGGGKGGTFRSTHNAADPLTCLVD